jgi:hypothetical protein
MVVLLWIDPILGIYITISLQLLNRLFKKFEKKGKVGLSFNTHNIPSPPLLDHHKIHQNSKLQNAKVHSFLLEPLIIILKQETQQPCLPHFYHPQEPFHQMHTYKTTKHSKSNYWFITTRKTSFLSFISHPISSSINLHQPTSI